MSMSDPVADLLTRIRNGQRAKKSSVNTPSSRLRANVLDVLKREGYIRDYSDKNVRKGIDEIIIELKYYDGEPVIREINRVSSPGCRVYSKIKDLPRICNGLGIAILSTPQGVMSDAEARAANVGGEVLCHVF
ncbi:MAG: 30S ribosomal protein S8 [Pseudomonadota bacterium]|nr:30S ribosomal protein S8 [Pseudomonadota bacterium]